MERVDGGGVEITGDRPDRTGRRGNALRWLDKAMERIAENPVRVLLSALFE